MAKKKKTIPLTGNVTLATVRGRLEPDQVLDRYWDDDTELDEVKLDDRKLAKSARVPAEALWALLSLAVDGAVESVDPDAYDEDDTNDWGLMPEQEDRLRSNLQRLREEYLTNRAFVGLLSTDLNAACYWYLDAVVEAPWFADEEGYPIIDLGEIEFDDEDFDDDED